MQQTNRQFCDLYRVHTSLLCSRTRSLRKRQQCRKVNYPCWPALTIGIQWSLPQFGYWSIEQDPSRHSRLGAYVEYVGSHPSRIWAIFNKTANSQLLVRFPKAHRPNFVFAAPSPWSFFGLGLEGCGLVGYRRCGLFSVGWSLCTFSTTAILMSARVNGLKRFGELDSLGEAFNEVLLRELVENASTSSD